MTRHWPGRRWMHHQWIGAAHGEWACLKCDRRVPGGRQYPAGGLCIRRQKNWKRDPVTGHLRSRAGGW